MKQGLQFRRITLDHRDIRGWVVFVLVLVTTCLIGLYARGVIEDNARRRFEDIAQTQRALLIDRLTDYEQVLLGASGLFEASASVERNEWNAYISSLRLDLTLPGIQGVGYTEMILPKNKAAHEARIRAEGFKNYAISPPGERSIYSSIVYLEPFTGRNLRAFGYDMYSNPVRRAAMDQAADTQEPAWSAKVTLVQEDDQGKSQPGFLVYVPIYDKNMPLRTSEERRAALKGFVYSPFRAWDMLSQFYDDKHRLFEMQLFAGPVNPENLLYETAPSDPSAKFDITLPIKLGGNEWHATFTTNANFNREMFSSMPFVLLLFVLVMESLLFFLIVLDGRYRKRIQVTAEQLSKTNHEIKIIANGTQLLQNCHREEEAFPILNRILADLFPDVIGACYLLNNSETHFHLVANWGVLVKQPIPEFFAPNDCWAHRRSQPHFACVADSPDVRCAHLEQEMPPIYACVPLMAQGKMIGDLYIGIPADHGTREQQATEMNSHRDLLLSVADTISLSLSNLRLRHSMHELSIRDPLTDLYNRRYMEEGLQREVERVNRDGGEVAVVMLDVDHFKPLNDTYGHEAGDQVLQEISNQLKRFRSGSDLVCRYGGEEFVLILSGFGRDALEKRLEQVRHDISELELYYEGRKLPRCTISLGVARYPIDTNAMTDLISLADKAMYQAKQKGRNRIVWTDA